MASLYLHIPFCRRKCPYCSFSSCSGGTALYSPYVEALLEELASLARLPAARTLGPLETLFVGGGTPTCLPSPLLCRTVEAAVRLFGLVDGAEITVEINPGTVDERYLAALRDAGVNRWSFGVQSFANRELQLIGRIHDEAGAISAIEAAGRVGGASLNLDLMYGLPGQTTGSFQRTLQRALSFSPDHLSIYQLTVEPGTPLAEQLARGAMILPPEREVMQMDRLARRLCEGAGLLRYEIANFARQGRECRHNRNYWHNNPYLAAGAAAVSYLEGRRERRLADPAEYIRRIGRGEAPVVDWEQLPREAAFRETVVLGLRMAEGVSRRALEERFGLELADYYGATLSRLVAAGLLRLTKDRLRLTAKGWRYSNRIMAELV